jgi:hypothetical protein
MGSTIFCFMTLSIMALNATLSTTLGLSIECNYAKSHCAQCQIFLLICWTSLYWVSNFLPAMLNIIVLSVAFSNCYAECHYPECRQGECCGTLRFDLKRFEWNEWHIGIITYAPTFTLMTLRIMTFSISIRKCEPQYINVPPLQMFCLKTLSV